MQPTAAILSAHFPKEQAARVRQCAKRKGMTTSRYLYELVMGVVGVEEESTPKRRGNLRLVRGGKR
jgi:hypothetical protein